MKQILLTKLQRQKLIGNGISSVPTPMDHPPVVRLFGPSGCVTWLLSEILPSDHNLAFGLYDLGGGIRSGYINLRTLENYRDSYGLGVERDKFFESSIPLSVYFGLAKQSDWDLLNCIQELRRGYDVGSILAVAVPRGEADKVIVNRTGNMIPFSLGRIYIAPGAAQAFKDCGVDARGLLRRHASADWGEIEDEDRDCNLEALRVGARIYSSYTLPGGIAIWVITEDDRSATGLFLPDEYPA